MNCYVQTFIKWFILSLFVFDSLGIVDAWRLDTNNKEIMNVWTLCQLVIDYNPDVIKEKILTSTIINLMFDYHQSSSG